MMQCNNLAAACATSHLVHSLRCFYVTQMEVLFFYKVISHSTKADEENRHVNQQRQAPHHTARHGPVGDIQSNIGHAQRDKGSRQHIQQRLRCRQLVGNDDGANEKRQRLKAVGLRVTRLARGVPVGSELEYVDLGTIAHALADRR